MTKQERLEIANEIFRICASHGRRFFSQDGDRNFRMENPRISRFELDANGRLWYIDKFHGSRLYATPTRAGGFGALRSWRFSDGGTLLSLVENLRDFIQHSAPIRNHFGPWRKEMCGGDLWAYGHDEMQKVRDEVLALLQEKEIWEKKTTAGSAI